MKLSFLKQFAKLKRQNSLAKIIAITGSAGKTSLKNLIKQLLQNFEILILHLDLLIITLVFQLAYLI